MFAPAEEGDVVGLAAAELLLLLELELHAAIPVTRQAANTIAHQREPVLVHRRVPVKRTIARSASLRVSLRLTTPLLCCFFAEHAAARCRHTN